MTRERVYKTDRTSLQRLFRLIAATVDPRALLHGFKILNYYNYTHVAELRKVTRGKDVRIGPTASFANGHNIELGDRVRIGANSTIWAGRKGGRIVLGADAMLAPNVMLTAANYRFDEGSPVTKQAMDESDIVVGRDVWIGYGAVILPGVRIGDRAIVGAGAVVRDDVPDNGVVVGNPARVVRTRRQQGATPPPARDIAEVPSQALLDRVRQETGITDSARLSGPIEDSGVDSFALITLRTSLEEAAGRQVPDADWARIASLEDVARLPSLQDGADRGSVPTPRPTGAPAASDASGMADAAVSEAPQPQASRALDAPGTMRRDYVLNMPQMALSGLGESWLFKELGDVHWAMITDFLKARSSAISDESGARLYATFTRITLEAEPGLRGFTENDPMTLASTLERYGASFFFGTHDLGAPEGRVRARTMSTFARFGERGANTSLIKGTPTMPDPDAIPGLSSFPDFGTEYRERRAAAPGKDAPLFECDYEVLPSHDINGVGLLYFAAYPTIFDLCFERAEGKGYLLENSTVSKDICYFANAEPTETLVFRLHARDEMTEGPDNGLVRHVASLSRKSDGHRMAEIISTKRHVGRAIPN